MQHEMPHLKRISSSAISGSSSTGSNCSGWSAEISFFLRIGELVCICSSPAQRLDQIKRWLHSAVSLLPTNRQTTRIPSFSFEIWKFENSFHSVNCFIHAQSIPSLPLFNLNFQLQEEILFLRAFSSGFLSDLPTTIGPYFGRWTGINRVRCPAKFGEIRDENSNMYNSSGRIELIAKEL